MTRLSLTQINIIITIIIRYTTLIDAIFIRDI